MYLRFWPRLLALGWLAFPPGLRAQIDYRNLDGGRPTRVEDAYPIERHGFELSLPYRFTSDGGREHSLDPSLTWGGFRNGSLGLVVDWQPARSRVPAAVPRVRSSFVALMNLAGESPTRPAIAVQAEIGHPLDRGSAGSASLTLGGIATRSWGLVRLHLNGAWTVAAPADRSLVAEPRWWAGLAVDRTLFRTSTLLIGEATAERKFDRSDLGWAIGVGLRRQLTPTLVLDAGGRLIRGDERGFAVTLGLNHAFAIAALMGAGRGTGR